MKQETMLKFDTLTQEALMNIEGGGCNWKDAGAAVIGGAIGGAVGGLAGAGLGALGSAVGYGATCWW
ncbi:TPA: Blp family class II bacteriocin [Streptococcus suis]|nr:bacteriocin [Streptococcus suis]HEM4252313.1 Blp family class II bacteriocin [Streptococcus suis]